MSIILQESGDKLRQENADNLLLEQDVLGAFVGGSSIRARFSHQRSRPYAGFKMFKLIPVVIWN
jgi:hypothetical protein